MFVAPTSEPALYVTVDESGLPDHDSVENFESEDADPVRWVCFVHRGATAREEDHHTLSECSDRLCDFESTGFSYHDRWYQLVFACWI